MFFLFDIGGTNMRGAISDGRKLLDVKIVPTKSEYADCLLALETLAHDFGVSTSYSMAVGGIAGILDRNKDRILLAPNLPGWNGKYFSSDFQKRLGVPVKIENDTALSGLGESLHGAGRDKQIVAYIGIGTGVGGVRIVKNAIDSHTYGFEPGHTIVDKGNEENQTLESLVGGKSILKTYDALPQEITDPMVWRSITNDIFVGVYNTVLYWSPDIIVLGGGIIEEGKVDLEKINRNLQQKLFFLPEVPLVTKALLSGKSALYGAQSLVGSGN